MSRSPHKENRRRFFDDSDEDAEEAFIARRDPGKPRVPYSVPSLLAPSRVYTMAVKTESFLHLARPLAPAVIGVQPTTAPLNVIIQPQVRFLTLQRT
jgi:hypothetical protein